MSAEMWWPWEDRFHLGLFRGSWRGCYQTLAETVAQIRADDRTKDIPACAIIAEEFGHDHACAIEHCYGWHEASTARDNRPCHLGRTISVDGIRDDGPTRLVVRFNASLAKEMLAARHLLPKNKRYDASERWHMAGVRYVDVTPCALCDRLGLSNQWFWSENFPTNSRTTSAAVEAGQWESHSTRAGRASTNTAAITAGWRSATRTGASSTGFQRR